MDYFRYHIDDMGEQKETERGCHDYCGLIFVLPFKNSFIPKFFRDKKRALLMVSHRSDFSLPVLAESGFEDITEGEKKEHSLGHLREKWVSLILV